MIEKLKRALFGKRKRRCKCGVVITETPKATFYSRSPCDICNPKIPLLPSQAVWKYTGETA